MKRLFLTAALGVVCVSTFGQGTVNFANSGVGLTAKITDIDGVALVGSAWNVDLYWASGVVLNSDFLTPLNQPATFSTVPSQAGFFFGGTRTVPAAAGSIITAQLRVWDSAYSSWFQANQALGFGTGQIGASVLYQVTLGAPNTAGTTMTGLNGGGFQLFNPVIPEPSTLALAALGFASLLALRRRADPAA